MRTGIHSVGRTGGLGGCVSALTALVVACLLAAVVPAAAQDAYAPLSEECRTLRADVDADIGDVMKAGCEPSLAQMSRLMDNPLGNVAMLFTQFDWFRLTNATGSSGTCRAFPSIRARSTIS